VATSTGIVTVTGAGSQWLITSGQFYVGWLGNGTLNIQNGGRVFAPGATNVGANASSSGTLNINSGGTLETSVLRNVNGAAQVNFDNGILRATASNATFISGFAGTQLNIAAGGLTIHTAGFTVGTDAASAFTGAGGLTVTGGGVFNLLASSAYSGVTSVQSGSSLALQGAGSIANSSRVVVDGSLNLASATSPAIRSLAGSGSVVLGAQSLTITSANDLFAGIISGAGGLTLSGGTQTLSGANNYVGATTVNGGTLRAGATNTFSAASAVTVLSGTLDLAGFNQTLASLSNAGVVNLGGAPGTSLAVAGAYTGSGGTLVLNSALGGDASSTDRLVAATIAGTTTLRVRNVGGAGAPTTEGIKVIDVTNPGGSTGGFALQGDYVFHGQQAVIGGAYAYTLQQNGVSTPADGDWYLRSALINPPASVPAGPIYQPGVPLYERYGQILLGLAHLPTTQQRAGARALDGSDANRGATASLFASADMATAASDVLPDNRPRLWARVEGRYGQFKPTTTIGSRYDIGQVAVQGGLDVLLMEVGGGRLIAGFNAQYTNASAAVRSVFGDGTINIDGYSLGGTLTWTDAQGFYVDGQARVMWFDSTFRSDIVAGTVAKDSKAFAHAFSLEGGKRFALGGAWSVTPQAQLSYASVSANFTDRFGTPVSLADATSLLGRLGIAADYANVWRDADGQTARSSVYGFTNLYYEFLDGAVTNVAGTSFASANQRLWGGVGLGGAYSWANDRYALYAEASVNTSLKDFGASYSLNGMAGFRLKW
jgi:fibronectin-binding autotransporter adhesin